MPEAASIDVTGQPLAPESLHALEYLRSRAAKLTTAGLRERVRAATQELEHSVAAVTEADARAHPLAGKWSMTEVVDHIAQTQIRGAEELRHLLAGRRPPGPPVYEALRSGAAGWAPWPELVDGLRSANQELTGLLDAAPDDAAPEPTARSILVVDRTLPDGRTGPQIFAVELGWKEYALVQRLHLLDHRNQIKKLREALAARGTE